MKKLSKETREKISKAKKGTGLGKNNSMFGIPKSKEHIEKIRKTIARKYAQHVHISQKRAMKEFPMIKNILMNPEIRKELKLSEDEIGYLENKKF